MDEKTKANMHNEIDAILERYNVVDFFYCGVMLDDKDFSSISYGRNVSEYSNRQRLQRLLGLIDLSKVHFTINAIENSNSSIENSGDHSSEEDLLGDIGSY